MATIGQTLTAPESGWRRYDDTDIRLKYTGTWASALSASTYNGAYIQTSAAGSYVTFKFYGTKLRIIGVTSTAYGSNHLINIDGVNDTFTEYNAASVYQALVYEKTNLSLGYHTVTITLGTVYLLIDAVDIDSTGYLAHSYINGGIERADLASMQIGDFISCEYVAAVSGAIGAFSNLGTSTKSDIPVTGAATPSGKFNFIKVAKGLLIADRVLQYSISWDTLNTGKLIEGGTEILAGTVKYKIRSLSGGVTYADANGNSSTTDQSKGGFPTNNEWDKYIVNSNLGGKITAGDDNIWHWKNALSIMRETPILAFGANTNRIRRGSISAIYIDWISSSGVVTTMGFRPVLEYLEFDTKATNMYY